MKKAVVRPVPLPPDIDEGPSEADIARAENVAEREVAGRSGSGWVIKGISIAGGLLVAGFLVAMLIDLVPRGRQVAEVRSYEDASVVSVLDGRTIKVSISGREETVRYIGVATPEVGQEYAGQVIETNRMWVGGRQVVLERDAEDMDREGHLLRYVYVDGYQVNAALLAAGLAWASDPGKNLRFRADFQAIETAAREAREGMWERYKEPPAGASSLSVSAKGALPAA